MASLALKGAGDVLILLGREQGWLGQSLFQQIVVGRVDAVWETDTAVSDWMLKNPGQYEVGYAMPKTGLCCSLCTNSYDPGNALMI